MVYRRRKVSLEYNYVSGNLEGIQKTYYKDGTLKTRNKLQKNMMEGSYIEYFEDGKTIKIKGSYTEDKKDGTWQEFDKKAK